MKISGIRLWSVSFARFRRIWGGDSDPPSSADGVNDGEDDAHAEKNPTDIECDTADAAEAESESDESDDE